MNFNPHYDLANEHAFLSASKHHWTSYTPEKMLAAYGNYLAAQRGTRLHEFARECIELKQKLPRSKKSLNCFVNDALLYRLVSEQPLFYSYNAFGTADAIGFSEQDNLLRIHDLKTGTTKVSMKQLEVYAALFCLEYNKDPKKIRMELRVYQNNHVYVHTPSHKVIIDIMDKMVAFDALLESKKTEKEE